MPLHDDFDLQISDIQALSSRDELMGLFAKLGYNTQLRLTQTADAMHFTNAALKREVKHIERIADHEDRALQVYLAELKSVTVSITQAIARALVDQAGDFLWVLTSDYQRIDFVLMERSLPVRPANDSMRSPRVSVRPRVLTVNRRNPSAVDLRVLRRFSYTEADADYQFQKLQSAYTIAEWSEPLFNNRALFSDYYLNVRLKDVPEWAETARMTPALRQLQTAMVDVRQRVGRQREAVARRELIEPALKALGFAFTATGSLSKGEGKIEPDYHLFADSNRSKPVAYCNAYVWGRNLDGRDDENRDPDSPDENPGAQVVSLLDRDDAPDWAIVTNGKFWRLYARRAHSRATNYYEIDLEETIASPDPGLTFRYFWLLFQATAFAPTTQRAGKSFLNWLFDECALYAKELEERLKDRVFGDIFPHFARGFIENMGGSAALLTLPVADREQRLVEVYHGTLTFLYRLLFLLYAESRNLLPANEQRGYWEISLARIKDEIARAAGSIEDEAEDRLEKAYRANSTELYDRLFHLFDVINRGDASVNVPVYNGGLFVTDPRSDDDSHEAADARFLVQHKIPDRFLALGLDRMARDIDPKRGDLVFIDYKSLGVRQLGSIYEGLLEFKVRVAPEKMAVVRGKKADEIISYNEAQKTRRTILKSGRGRSAADWTLPKGTVYLENDKRERKATGSYYTPDYIVKYIVEHTVGPVLAEKFEAITPRIREVQKNFKDTVNRKRTIEKVSPDEPKLLIEIAKDVLRDLFDVKVLDPAMGSGHFLVEAVDYITDEMVQFMNRFLFLSQFFAGTRQMILAEMEQQNVNIDPGRLTDVNLLKRHVLKRSVYGVDLNPMAVELAKVSLWLDCFTLGAPLSFLDHHLKPGNSLIGASVEEVRSAVELVQTTTRHKVIAESAREYKTIRQTGHQFEMFGSMWTGAMLATDLMRHVGELSDVTAEQVKASRAEFRKASDALEPYKRIVNVYVSRWFGNEPSKSQSKLGLEPTIDFLRRDGARAWLNDPKQGVKQLDAAMKHVAETAQQAAKDKRFFHWELEFPEVFFGPAQDTTQAVGLKEDGGFDAVVGNPPYVRVQRMGYDDTDFFKERYRAAYRRVDIATLFLEQSVNVSRGKGVSGLILSSQFMTADYGQSLREFLLEQTTPTILDLKDLPVFEDALTYVCVYIGIKAKSPYLLHADLFSVDLKSTPEKIPALLSSVKPNRVDKARLSGAPWSFGTDLEAELFEKLSRISDRLGAIGEARTGLFTGLDEVMMIYPEDEIRYGLEKGILLPVASGTEPDRYFLNSPYKKVIYPYKEVDGETVLLSEEELKKEFPRAYAYLKQSKSKLESRRDSRREFSENKSWYQLTRFGSLPLFRSRKILTPGEVQRNSFCLDEDGVAFSVARVFSVTSPTVNLHYLLGILNSKLIEYQLRKIAPPKQGGYSAYSGGFLEQAFIRRIDFAMPAKRRAELVAQAKDFHNHQDQSGLLAIVEQRLTAQPEESDVVHDVLAFLAEKMINFNKQKQAEQKRFLTWLEGALKIKEDSKGNTGLDALSGKTTIRNYVGDYQKGAEALSFAELEDVLFKNRSRLGVSLSDSRLVARLRTEYEKSLGVLLPIKERLAWTDALIDQVVYKLYGLTEEEIAIVEGQSTTEPEAEVTPRRESDRPESIARESDPRVLAEVLEELLRLGPVTTKQLSDSIMSRIGARLSAAETTGQRGTKLAPDKADTIKREFGFLGWIDRSEKKWVLTSEGEALAQQVPSMAAVDFAQQVCVANDQKNQQVVSRLLARLWELNPDRQGAVIIPQPPLDNAPDDLSELRDWLLPLIPKWTDGLRKQMSGFAPEVMPEQMTGRIIEALSNTWKKMPPSKRRDRLQEVIAERFTDMMFSHIISPSDVEIWQSRMDWAGLTLTARDLAGVAGKVWFPVGSFREASGPDFTAVDGLRHQGQLFYRYTPSGEELERQFGEAMFEGYMQQQRREQVEYVSLMAVRDWVCFRLRIGNPVFESALQSLFPKAIRGEAPYSLALEVDVTPSERNRLRGVVPVIIDGNARYIIAMRRRQ